MTSANSLHYRTVVRVVRGRETSDGAGVRLIRVIGGPELDALDPFLLLDAFRSDNPEDYIAGFPPHPHRGFETVTYLIAGHMRHRDNAGHEGVIETGGVQWMTAGRGIVHSEMPEQDDGLLFGFQLWVNLAARDKMTAPRYQELGAGKIPVEVRPGAQVRVIAGTTSEGTTGPVHQLLTPVTYLDVQLEAEANFSEHLPAAHNVIVHPFEGELILDGKRLAAGDLAVMGPGDQVEFRAGSRGARLLLLSGQPLDEPVARHGPFVMNTREEITQAFRDYQSGHFGD